jgi:endonuclease/exonuclease/phosphatase family metal-dependent hydrolase
MIRRLFYIFNVVLFVLLFMACLSCYIGPLAAWPLSFLGLGFSLLIIFLLAFLVLWAMWRQKIFWANLLALVLCLPFIRTVYAFHFSPAQEKGIKLMSYNVRNFDLYNWSGNKKTRSRIMGLIGKENPDIICFQEFYTEDENFRNAEYLRDSLGYKYHYFHVTYDQVFKNTSLMKWYRQLWGLAIFSRYPIIDTGVVQFDEKGGNQCMYADLNIDGKTLRVYDTHLQSIHLGYDDYDTIEELSENQNTNWYRIRNILKKMKHAFSKRAAQARLVHDSVSKYEGKKIVCGDFNDSPVSYTYQTISKGLNDAFICKGKGFGESFDTKLGFFRIDFILTDPSIRVNSYRSIHKSLSDHFPVVVTLSI